MARKGDDNPLELDPSWPKMFLPLVSRRTTYKSMMNWVCDSPRSWACTAAAMLSVRSTE
jgi:hypothetical protein